MSKPFSVSALDAERNRLTQLFRNNGYYYYSTDYSTYLADTFQLPYRAQLRLQLADSVPSLALRPWYIGRVDVTFRKTAREQVSDSLVRRFTTFRFNGKNPPLRPRVVLRDMKLRPRNLFSLDDYQQSVQKLNSQGIFSSVDLQMAPRDHDTLDLKLVCTFDKPYDFYFEADAVSRTIGRMGPTVKLGLTRRNAFRGGEKIDINLHGSYEWQTNGSGQDMNSYQMNTTHMLNPSVKLYVDMPSGSVAQQYASTFAEWWRYSDTQVKSADYVKLRSINLAYHLPHAVCKRLHIGATRLTLQASNLLTWSAAGRDIDPESYGLNSGTRTLPQPKTYSIGFSTSF